MAEKWTRRFVWAAVIHGVIAVILTVLFIIPSLGLASMIAVGFVGGPLHRWICWTKRMVVPL
jgi:hypothetical protein